MIHLRNITKSFGSLQVLRGIDLDINQGEVVSIVGPSGAGKTTLLQIMGTLDQPDTGEIIIDGQNGIIVPSRNEEALYLAMKRFVDNPDEVDTMAANARPLIASRYEQGYVRQCLYDFYKEILKN